MKLNVDKQYPINFEIIETPEFEIDSRFRKCKVWICHDGVNLNNSVFSPDLLRYMGKYLAGVPIVGFIDKNKYGEIDFRGHEMILKKEKDGYVFEYLCVPFGTVLESNNAKIEEKIVNGIKKNFLTCEGILYNRYQKCIDIFERDGNEKSQSMELEESSIEGAFNDLGQFEFSKAKIEMLTMLGTDVTPAMTGANVTMFTSNEFKQSFALMLDEIKETLKKFELSANQEKGGVSVEDLENKEVEIEEVETTEVVEETTNEVVEEEFAEEIVNDETESETETFEEVEVVECGSEDVSNNKKYTLEFELSHEDIRNSIWDKLYELCVTDNAWYGVVKTNDDYFIYGDGSVFFKQSYSKLENSIELVGERERVYTIIVSENVYNELNSNNLTFESILEENKQIKSEVEIANNSIKEFEVKLEVLETNNKELTEFKATKLKEELKVNVDNIVSQFSFEELDIIELKTKAYNEEISLETLQEKLFALVGKKNFSAINKEQVIKPVTFSLKETEKCPYAGLEHLFNK